MNSVLRIIILPVRFCSIMRRASSDLSYQLSLQLPLNCTCRNTTRIVRNDYYASNLHKYGTIMSASLFLVHTLNLLSSLVSFQGDNLGQCLYHVACFFDP